RNAAARLPGHDEETHRSPLQIDPLLTRHLRQPQRIGWGTEHHGRLIIKQEAQPGGAAHAPSRKTQKSQSRGGVKRRPKTKERTKGKRKEQPIPRANTNHPVDRLPTAQQPSPAFWSVQPAQGLARRSGGLTEPHVTR